MKRIASTLVLFLWSGLAIAGWLPLAYSSAQQAAFFAAAGSDANPCTQASPCLTIARANAIRHLGGSTINFNGGDTFSGGIVLTTTNAPFGNITVQSYGSGQATISSGNSTACLTATNVPAVIIPLSNSIICTGGGNTTNTTAGISIVNSQAGNTKLAGPFISGVTVSGYGYNCISIQGSNGSSGFSNTVITGNTVHDCTGNSTDSFGTAAIYVFSKTATTGNYAHANVTITGNTAYNLTGTSGSTIWSGSGIIASQSTNVIIGGSSGAKNVVHDFGDNASTFDPVGIWTQDSSTCTISYNEVYNGKVLGDGFDIDQNTSGCIVEHNWSHDNAGFSYLASHGGSGTWNNNTFRFNIGQNGGKGEFGFFFITNAGTVNIYNNTFSNFNIGKVFNRGNDSGPGTITAVVANNIIAGAGGNLLSIVVPGSISFTGNDYYTYGQAFSVSWNGSTYSSFATWQTATSQEKISGANVGLISNPSIYVPGGGFTNAGYVPANLMAYNLQAGSPMIGAGLNLTTQFGINPGTTDYYGVAVTAATLPVGAAAGDFTTFAASCTAAANYLARVSSFTKLDNVNYNSRICGSVSDGDFALMSVKYMLAAPNHAAGILNLVSTSFTLTEHGTCTFTARVGIQGDGSTCFEDTGFTKDSNFTQNSGTIAVYSLSASAIGTSNAMGNSDTVSGAYNDISNRSSNGTFIAVNEGGAGNGTNIGQITAGKANVKGYQLAQRTGVAAVLGYSNGVNLEPGTSEASGAIANLTTMYLFALNQPPASGFTTDQLASALIGNGTVSPLREALRDNSFMQAYGINVY